MEQHEWWLKRFGLVNLVAGMWLLSGEYELSWADSWGDHLDEPKWLDRAMMNSLTNEHGLQSLYNKTVAIIYRRDEANPKTRIR